MKKRTEKKVNFYDQSLDHNYAYTLSVGYLCLLIVVSCDAYTLGDSIIKQRDAERICVVVVQALLLPRFEIIKKFFLTAII